MSCACRYRGTVRSGSLVGLQRAGILGLVRMVGTRVDLQLRELLPRKPVLREHPLDCNAQHFSRPALELVAQRPAPQASRIARVAVESPLVERVSRAPGLLP